MRLTEVTYDWHFNLIDPVSIDTDTLNNIYISGFNYIIKVKEDGNLLKIFETTSIAVACSRWDEPLGRTSLEASSRGCATIISNKGGLPETVTHGIILKELNVNSVYHAIKDLIENKKRRIEIQKLSIKNFFHTNKVRSQKIDE